MGCGHEIWEQDTASHADGLCPLCLSNEVALLRKALEQIDTIAVSKKKGAAKLMQLTAIVALGRIDTWSSW